MNKKPVIKVLKRKVVIEVPEDVLLNIEIKKGEPTPLERAFIAGFRYGGYLKQSGKNKSINHYEFRFYASEKIKLFDYLVGGNKI